MLGHQAIVTLNGKIGQCTPLRCFFCVAMNNPTDIRDIAIIAHVDHGKTTLVDGMLKQTHTFRDNQAEMQQTTILDRNELEREKGITILAKNTAVNYKGVKINIIDTPGHADFGGEVERVLNMADAALLVIDAADGPMPQTRHVLQKALQTGLKIIVVINKIDKKDARPGEVLRETEELFLKLATHSKHLEFPVVYAVGRDGKAFHKAPTKDDLDKPGDLTPLFETILKEVPNAVRNTELPVQALISTLDYDPHLGKLGVGRIRRGVLKRNQSVVAITPEHVGGTYRIEKIYTSEGIGRLEIEEAVSGDIVAIAGIGDIEIGQTIADPQNPEALEKMEVDEPTLKVTIGANTSPFAGREGKYVTSRQIGERLEKEKEVNLGMRFADLGGGEFEVAGRGELHLAILIETMRREGYELQVSKPQVIIKDGLEPFDEVTVEVPDEYVGVATTEMGKRRAEMIDMEADGKGTTAITYLISERNMIGVRNLLLIQTRGNVVISHMFVGYKPLAPVVEELRNGALVSFETGKVTGYTLENAQMRGVTFVDPGDEVYEGMVVGLNNRLNNIDINLIKGKHLTNMRAANKEMKLVITPAYRMSLEQALDFIEEDELIEVTPKNLRFRKKRLSKLERIRYERKERRSENAE
jgi:GTP-binding protein